MGGRCKGGEEEQVVFIYFNNVSLLNLVPFPSGKNTSCQACIERNTTDTYIQYTRHLYY